jgi:hypothetical protein
MGYKRMFKIIPKLLLETLLPSINIYGNKGRNSQRSSCYLVVTPVRSKWKLKWLETFVEFSNIKFHKVDLKSFHVYRQTMH